MATLTIHPYHSRLHRWAALLVFAGLGSQFFAATRPVTTGEYEVKAAAFYNIIAFTDWPATAFASPDAPLVVGVLGQGPINARLNDFMPVEAWHGRRIVVRRVSTPDETQACHVVYVGRSEAAGWRTLSAECSGRPILTVSDMDRFAEQGGVVQLAIERNRLRLIVNLKGARASGLTISAKVLRLAHVIDDRQP